MLRLLFVAGLLVVIALAAFNAGSPRSAFPTVVPGPTNPPPTPAPDEVAVEITDATLTEQLNARLSGQPIGDTPLGPASLRRLNVELHPGQMLTTGDAQIGATTVPLTITSGVDLRNGRPVVVVHDARAGNVPLPDEARQSLQRAMQAQVDEAISRRPMRIRSLTITTGRLLAIGTP